MELRYCENCGDILELPDASGDAPVEGFVCAACRGEAPGSEPRRSHAAGTAGAREPAGPGASAGSTWLDSENLELFSNRSFVMRKKALETELSADERRAGGTVEAELESQSSCPIDELEDLEVGPWPPESAGTHTHRARQTVARLEEEDVRDTARGRAPQDGVDVPATPLSFFDEVGDEVGGGQPMGSQLPASRAQKIIFRCPHCKSALSIRPVTSTSRLVCPTCEGASYVTISGRISKDVPSASVRLLRRGGSFRETAKRPAGDATGRHDDDAGKVLAAGLKRSNPLDNELRAQEAREGVREGAAAGREARSSVYGPHAPPPPHGRQHPGAAAESSGDRTLFITEEPETDLSELDLGFEKQGAAAAARPGGTERGPAGRQSRRSGIEGSSSSGSRWSPRALASSLLGVRKGSSAGNSPAPAHAHGEAHPHAGAHPHAAGHPHAGAHPHAAGRSAPSHPHAQPALERVPGSDGARTHAPGARARRRPGPVKVLAARGLILTVALSAPLAFVAGLHEWRTLPAGETLEERVGDLITHGIDQALASARELWAAR